MTLIDVAQVFVRFRTCVYLVFPTTFDHPGSKAESNASRGPTRPVNEVHEADDGFGVVAGAFGRGLMGSKDQREA